MDTSEDLPFRSVIVAGAPRSGTHFLHSLICTSEKASPFAPEYHYFYFLLEAYLRALKVFNAAESAGFANKEAFARHHFGLMRATLRTGWEHLGRAENLVLKHCSLTPLLPILARQFDNMKFVVIMRDARDTIASEVRAARKSRGNPTTMPMDVIEHSIFRYNLYYGNVVSSSSVLGDRLHCVMYEDIVSGNGFEELRSFLGFPDISPDKLWERSTFDIGNYKNFHLHSDLWGKPISTNNIGRFEETLPQAISERVWRETRKVALCFEARCSAIGESAKTAPSPYVERTDSERADDMKEEARCH